MRDYEGLVLVKPELNQEHIDSLLKEINDNIVENGGSVEESKLWKKSKLSYEIDHYTEGNYLFSKFKLNPQNLEKLKRFCRLNSEILRVLFIKSNEA